MSSHDKQRIHLFCQHLKKSVSLLVLLTVTGSLYRASLGLKPLKVLCGAILNFQFRASRMWEQHKRRRKCLPGKDQGQESNRSKSFCAKRQQCEHQATELCHCQEIHYWFMPTHWNYTCRSQLQSNSRCLCWEDKYKFFVWGTLKEGLP